MGNNLTPEEQAELDALNSSILSKEEQNELDALNGVVKKKVGTVDSTGGLEEFAQASGNIVKNKFGSKSNLILKSDQSKSDLKSEEAKVRAEKFLGAGKYAEEKKPVQKIEGIDTSIKLKETIEGQEPVQDNLQFTRTITPILTPPKGIKKFSLPKEPVPEMSQEEFMSTLDLYKDVPQAKEMQKVSFLETGTKAGEGELQAKKQKGQNEIKEFIQQTKNNNTALLSSKPKQSDLVDVNSGISANFKDLSGELTRESPDGSDTGYWLMELEDYKTNQDIKNTVVEINGRKMEMPSPLKKVVEDYYYYLYNNDNEMYKRATSHDLSDKELSQVFLGAIQHQQDKINAEYQAKNQPDNFLIKPNINWEWNNKDLQEASQFLTSLASDYLEKKPDALSAGFREARQEDVVKKVQQALTDVEYEQYKEDGGIFLNPIDGIYYNVYTPVKESTQDFARGLMTLPRAVGLDYYDTIDSFVNMADEYFTPSETNVPTELKENFNWNNGLYKTVRGLSDFAYLILGTKGLSAAGMSSKASMFMTSLAMTNDNYFNEGMDAGMDKSQARNYSNIASVIQAMLEGVSPNKNLTEGFRVNVTNKVMKDIAEGKAVKLSFKERMDSWFKEIGQEELQEFSQLFAEKGTNYVANIATGSQLNTDITAAEMLETGLVTFAVTGIANAGSFRQTSDLSNNAIYQLSSADNESRTAIIQNNIEKGVITPEQGQNLIDKTNEMRKIIAGIPSKYTAQQRMDMAITEYQIQVAEANNKEKVINPIFEEDQPNTVEKLNAELLSKKEKYDSEQRKEPIPGEERIGEKSKQTKPQLETGQEEIGDGGVLQETEQIKNVLKPSYISYDNIRKSEAKDDIDYIFNVQHSMGIGNSGYKSIEVNGKNITLRLKDHNPNTSYVQNDFDEGTADFFINIKTQEGDPRFKGADSNEELDQYEENEPRFINLDLQQLDLSVDELKDEVIKHINRKIQEFKKPEQVDKIDDVRPTEEAESLKWEERVLNKFDEWEKDLEEFGKGTLGINVPVVVGKGAIKAMKGIVKTAASVQDIVQAGIDYVKTTDWYLSKGENDRKNIEDDLHYNYSRKITAVKKVEAKVKEKQARLVERTEKKVAALILEDVDRGVKQAAKEQKNLSKEIENVLKKPSIVTQLSLPQYKALINEARKVSTPEELEVYKTKVQDILEKQNEENIAKEKKAEANKNKSKIRKASISKTKTSLASDKPILKEFGKLNPNKVKNIDEYNNIASQILDKQNRTISNAEIQKYVKEQTEYIDNEIKKDLLKRNGDLLELKVINKDMSLDELRETLEGYKTTAISGIKQQQKLEERAERNKEKREELQMLIKEKLTELNNEVKGEDLSDNRKEAVNALNNIDRTELKDETLHLINRVLDNITINNSYARAGDVVIIYKVQEAIREYKFELSKLGYDSLEQFLSDSADGFEKGFKEIQKKILSPSQLLSAIEMFNQLKGLSRDVIGIQDLYSGHSDVIKRMKSFDDAFRKKQNKNNRGFVSQIRQSMASMISQNYGGTKEDIQNDFDKNKKRLKESVKRSVINVVETIYNQYEHKRTNKKRVSLDEKTELIKTINESKSTTELLDKLKERFPLNKYKKADFSVMEVYANLIENANNSEEVFNKLNKYEIDMIDFLRDEYASIQEDLFEVSDMYGNNIPELVENYLPLVYEKMVGESRIKTEKDINVEEGFFKDVINRSETATTIERNKGLGIAEGRLLSTNFHFDMERKFREALYQIKTLAARKTIVRVLGNKDFRDVFGKGNADALNEYMVRAINSQLNLSESDPAWLAIAGSATKLASAGTRIALGSWVFGRINQMVNIQIGASIRLGKGGFARVPKNPDSNLFKYSNVEEAIITQAGFKQDYYLKDQEIKNELNKLKKWYRSVVDVKDSKIEWLDNFALSELGKGDAIARKNTWMRYYKAYRVKRDGVKDFNWKKEYANPSKRASAYADQNIEETQSGNSFSALSPVLTKRRDLGALLQKTYLGFQTFAVTLKGRMSVASRKLRKGIVNQDAKLIQEATAEILSVTAEASIYSVMKTAQGVAITYAAILGAMALFDLDEDEAEELMPYPKLEDYITRAGGNVMKDLFITGIPLADAPASEFLNWAWKKSTGSEKNIFYQKTSDTSSWWDSFGSYAPAIGAWYNFGSTVLALWNGVDYAEKEGFESKAVIGKRELTPEERDYYYVLLAFDTAKLLGFSDQSISSIINKYRRIIEKKTGVGQAKIIYNKGEKKEKKKESSNARSSSRSNSRSNNRKSLR